MSKESSEHLSSLMDGELSRETGLFLTRRLSSDESMCETWERYHLIRDCIRQPGSKQVISGLSVRISKSLEAEDAPEVSRWRNNHWLKPVSGVAIAASVAMFAVIVVTGPQSLAPGGSDTATSTAANQPFVSPNTAMITPVSQAANYSSSAQKNSSTNTNRLNAYLLRHNQMARTAGRQGFVSFVPIVATPTPSVAEAVDDKPGTAGSNSEPEAKLNK